MGLTLLNILILAVAVLGMVGTLLTRNHAIRERTLLILTAAEHRDVAQHIAHAEAVRGARHETFQLFEHALVVICLAIWVGDVSHMTTWRNVILFVLSFLMSANSYLDLYSRRKLMRDLRNQHNVNSPTHPVLVKGETP